MNGTQRDLIYLLSCAVNGITPDSARVQSIDLEKLYNSAKDLSVTSAVCIALERAGVEDGQFHKAFKKAFCKDIYFDVERTAITDSFEKQGIWYMPLKGSVIKELYPETGMRQMSDNDILYDADKQEQVRDIMLAMGYSENDIGNHIHDVYLKPPVLNFELHKALFGNKHAESLYKYYSDIKRLMIKDEGNSFGYHLSDEDFYIYITAHEYKHFSYLGTGIRSLLDCYVYCKAKGDNLDWNYIKEECKKLEISDFEHKRRELAVKIFSSDTLPDLTDEETEMLMYYLTAGTYGTLENNIKKKLKGNSKLSFWLKSIFIPGSKMAVLVPFTAGRPLLYPLGVIWRCFQVLFFKRDKLRRTIKIVKKFGK